MLKINKKQALRPSLITLGLLSVIVISWFVAFDLSSKWLKKRIEVATSDLRQKGFEVSYSKVKVTGNPFVMKAIIYDASVKDPQARFEWKGQKIKISARPWNFTSITFVFPGHQTILTQQNFTFQKTHVVFDRLDGEGMKGVLYLNAHGMIEEGRVTIGRLLSFEGTTQNPLVLQGIVLTAKNVQDPLHLNLSFKAALVNPESALMAARPLLISLDASLAGFQAKAPLPKTLAEWRDGGGILKIHPLKLTWPPINIEFEGALTLDKEMYPLGSFSSRLEGYHEALSALVAMGWIKEKKVAPFSLVLSLLSSSDEAGKKELKLPITLQNKTFSVGPISLFKLKPVL